MATSSTAALPLVLRCTMKRRDGNLMDFYSRDLWITNNDIRDCAFDNLGADAGAINVRINKIDSARPNNNYVDNMSPPGLLIMAIFALPAIPLRTSRNMARFHFSMQTIAASGTMYLSVICQGFTGAERIMASMSIPLMERRSPTIFTGDIRNADDADPASE